MRQDPLPLDLTQRKGRQPRRRVSPRGGAGLAPAQGKGKPAQHHVALGSTQHKGGSPCAINIIIFIIIEGINIKNTIICVRNINMSIIV